MRRHCLELSSHPSPPSWARRGPLSAPQFVWAHTTPVTHLWPVAASRSKGRAEWPKTSTSWPFRQFANPGPPWDSSPHLSAAPPSVGTDSLCCLSQLCLPLSLKPGGKDPSGVPEPGTQGHWVNGRGPGLPLLAEPCGHLVLEAAREPPVLTLHGLPERSYASSFPAAEQARPQGVFHQFPESLAAALEAGC